MSLAGNHAAWRLQGRNFSTMYDDNGNEKTFVYEISGSPTQLSLKLHLKNTGEIIFNKTWKVGDMAVGGEDLVKREIIQIDEGPPGSAMAGGSAGEPRIFLQDRRKVNAARAAAGGAEFNQRALRELRKDARNLDVLDFCYLNTIYVRIPYEPKSSGW
jgi:hypothetical protein